LHLPFYVVAHDAGLKGNIKELVFDTSQRGNYEEARKALTTATEMFQGLQ